MSSAPPSKRRGNHYACRIAALPTHIASTRRLLAKWILVLGKQGERDRNQFVEKALALLADSNPRAREFLTADSSALPRVDRGAVGELNSRLSSSTYDWRNHHEQSIS